MGHDTELHVSGTVTLTAETLQNTLYQEQVPCDKKHILVACFPKSGSTWFAEIFSQLPDFYRVHLVPTYGHREQELTFDRLLIFHAFNYVAQHHCCYSFATEQYMRIFSIKPIVLVRNVFDCVVSLKEHIDTVKTLNDKEPSEFSLGRIEENYFSWTDEEKFDFIIDLCIPWYINFYVCWLNCPYAEWMNYEELRANPFDVIKEFGRKFDLRADGPAIEAALAAATAPGNRTRKNVGINGRGSARLSEAQKDRVRRLTRYYPTRDFSRIGL